MSTCLLLRVPPPPPPPPQEGRPPVLRRAAQRSLLPCALLPTVSAVACLCCWMLRLLRGRANADSDLRLDVAGMMCHSCTHTAAWPGPATGPQPLGADLYDPAHVFRFRFGFSRNSHTYFNKEQGLLSALLLQVAGQPRVLIVAAVRGLGSRVYDLGLRV